MKTLEQYKNSDKIRDRAVYIGVLKDTIKGEEYIAMMQEDIVLKSIYKAEDIRRQLFGWFEKMGYEIPLKVIRMERKIKELLKNHKHKKYQPSIQLLVNIEKARVALKNYKPYSKIPSRKLADLTIQQAEKKGLM